MNRRPPLSLILLLALACGSQSVEPAPTPSTAADPSSGSAAYDLHEWGLLSVSGNVVEVAAGPGTQVDVMEMLTVDKPVVYVHADGATRFTLSMAAQEGYAIAERWPVSPSISADIPAITRILWSVDATQAPCTERVSYPTSCTSVDGYCETRELALYEASDASCLQVDGSPASLLFYRLRATSPEVIQRLPVRLEAGQVRSTTSRSAWRVRRDASGATFVARVQLGEGLSDLPEAGNAGAASAAAWVHAELGRLGLTDSERGAFERAWWQSLFHMEAASSDVDQAPNDVLPATDSPVRVPDGDDGVVADETDLDRRGVDRLSADELEDMLIYFLTPAEIDDIARLEATPAARSIHRAFLVRQNLR